MSDTIHSRPVRQRSHRLVGIVLSAIAAMVLSTMGEVAEASDAAFTSDDFSDGLDTSLWSVQDLMGDGTVTTSGQGTDDAVVSLAVPSGSSHDPWNTNRALRLAQPVADDDFEVEVKFDSLPTAKYQGQGLIVEADDRNWLRFDVHHNGSSLQAFAASTSDRSSKAEFFQQIAASGSVWLRVNRTGDTWTMSWSDNGTNFNPLGSFDHQLAVSTVGPFAFNHNPNPAYTAVVDYVFDTASPIDPEDPAGEPDTTPPVISDVNVAATDTTATVTWTTDEPATSVVDYGTTATHGTTETVTGLTTNHQVVLDGLDADTTHHYAITSTDDADNTATTPDATFTTDAQPTTTWTLTTDTVGQGTVTTDPTGPDHPDGTDVTLTATPANGWTFDGWTGDTTSTDNPLTITIDADTTLTATFTQDDPPPDGDVVRIMPVGDSLTRGDVHGEGPGTEGTYRRPLLQDLAADGTDVDMVGPYDTHPSGEYEDQGQWDHDSFAVPGWTAANVRDGIGEALTTHPADLALLLVGVNDLRASSITPEIARDRVHQAIQNARTVDPGIAMLVAEIPPGAQVTGVDEFNALLRDLVAEQTTAASPLHTVDLNTGFSPSVHTTDGLHPNDLGEVVLASRWAEGLHEHFAIGDGDQSGPVLGPADVIADTESATITWSTDEPADSSLSWGLTTEHGNRTASDTLVMTHAVTVTGLEPATTYHYTVSSTDAAGNATASGGDTFTTQAASHTLTTEVAGQGSLTTDPPGTTHESGSSVTITASPASGWAFSGWSGDASGSQNPLTVTMDQDRSITATFVEVDGPTIDVWYGDQQTFGHNGRPQRWVNVLGNVSDEDGVQSLSYRLNGGSKRALSVGPDFQRLQFPGDFNVEIDFDELAVGDNDLKIVAVDTNGHQSNTTITVTRVNGSASLPTTVDWSAGTDPNALAQVVDGNWSLDGGVLRPTELGYDRLVAIGDLAWSDYEVTMPVTVHALGPDSGTPWSGAPLIGLGLRWPGHEPSAGAQPSTGFYPVGAYAWYRWQNGGRNELTGSGGSPIDRLAGPLELGTPYVMKASVTTVSGGTRYRYKMWKASDAEPDWQMEIVYEGGTTSGGVALIAHHVDASIGNVSVVPLP